VAGASGLGVDTSDLLPHDPNDVSVELAPPCNRHWPSMLNRGLSGRHPLETLCNADADSGRLPYRTRTCSRWGRQPRMPPSRLCASAYKSPRCRCAPASTLAAKAPCLPPKSSTPRTAGRPYRRMPQACLNPEDCCKCRPAMCTSVCLVRWRLLTQQAAASCWQPRQLTSWASTCPPATASPASRFVLTQLRDGCHTCAAVLLMQLVPPHHGCQNSHST
jgi:hypothetical protein